MILTHPDWIHQKLHSLHWHCFQRCTFVILLSDLFSFGKGSHQRGGISCHKGVCPRDAHKEDFLRRKCSYDHGVHLAFPQAAQTAVRGKFLWQDAHICTASSAQIGDIAAMVRGNDEACGHARLLFAEQKQFGVA